MTEDYSVIHVARNPNTGVASVIKTLAMAQKRRGVSTALLIMRSKSWKRPEWSKLLQYYELESPEVFGTAAFLYHNLRRQDFYSKVMEIRGNKNNKLILHFHDSWLDGALIDSGCLENTKHVSTFHGVAAEYELRKQPIRLRLHKFWAKQLAKNADAIVAVDETTPQRADNLVNINRSKFVVIPNGSCEPQSVKIHNGRSNGLVVGHLGTLDSAKGWEITAAAVDMARLAGLNVSYHIAGFGDGRSVEKWCAARSQYCKFYGWVENPVKNFLPQLDLLSMPSKSEGMPMAILEAMSLGIPTIATPVGGVPSMITNGVEGFLIQRNPQDLFEKMKEYCENGRLMTEHGANARKKWSDCYSDTLMEQAYDTLYRSLFANRI